MNMMMMLQAQGAAACPSSAGPAGILHVPVAPPSLRPAVREPKGHAPAAVPAEDDEQVLIVPPVQRGEHALQAVPDLALRPSQQVRAQVRLPAPLLVGVHVVAEDVAAVDDRFADGDERVPPGPEVAQRGKHEVVRLAEARRVHLTHEPLRVPA
eukprot:CAMPEP_0206160712 /NCGR_PEP_ID=MMETSP1474-20131121/7026_1 /ASSEMBLY_ACC=CAM_ASM_001110 /TAXON_ID=97495 /ORGANISM="Imantonia sp., Strain RCC918" /LENGTH=153 /DNA_ID=CAMNT_0053562215 /DNA_START=490 /DNA_END=948 /DNA_ORIENTATION=-